MTRSSAQQLSSTESTPRCRFGWVLRWVCAQCHTHKYDPITQKEFFQVFAIFNNTADADRGNEEPTIEELTRAQQRHQSTLNAKIATLERALKSEQSRLVEIDTDIDDAPIQGRYVRVELLGKKAFLSLAEVQVFSGDVNVATDGVATQVSEAFNGPARYAIDGNTSGEYTAGSTTHTAAEDNPWWQLQLNKLSNIARIVIWNRTDGGDGTTLEKLSRDRLRRRQTPCLGPAIQRSSASPSHRTTPAVR